MRSLRFAALVPAILLFSAGGALAGGAPTIGGRLSEIIQDLIGPLLLLVSFACFVGGLAILAKGLMKLKDATGGQPGTSSSALLHIVAAAFLIFLPNVAGIGMYSAMGNAGLFSQSDLMSAQANLDTENTAGSGLGRSLAQMGPVADVENCLAANSEAVNCMARNLARNVVPVGIIAVFGFVFVAGFWTLGSSLIELSRSNSAQGRGLPQGWWAKPVAGILMMNGPYFFMAAARTLMGLDGNIGAQGLDSGSSLLSYNLNLTDKLQPYEDLIGYLFVILTLFGAIAFVKGIFLLKSTAEGKQGASMSSGVVFMIAGVLLANAKVSTCTILNTMGGSGMTFGFCS